MMSQYEITVTLCTPSWTQLGHTYIDTLKQSRGSSINRIQQIIAQPADTVIPYLMLKAYHWSFDTTQVIVHQIKVVKRNTLSKRNCVVNA